MLTKAGKFKFNAETTLHSHSLCLGAGGGEESLQNQPGMVSTGQAAQGGRLGFISLDIPLFGNFFNLEDGGGVVLCRFFFFLKVEQRAIMYTSLET